MPCRCHVSENRDSRRRLQSILEGISDCYFTIDRQNRIIAANTRAAEWFGQPAHALTGVDYISIGSITKHVQAIDLSMRFEFSA